MEWIPAALLALIMIPIVVIAVIHIVTEERRRQ
jgi:hypothetical protein